MSAEENQDDVVQILEDDQLSDADKIRALSEAGFSRKQLVDEFDFSRSLVYRTLPVHAEAKDGGEKEDPRDDGLPVLRKMGAGMDMVTPEAVLRRYMDGEDEQRELRGMMKLRAAMLMVMDLVNILKGEAEADARRLEPILRLMQETRAEQDAAAQRAKGSSAEIAQQAAQEAVGSVVGYLEQKIPKGPPPKDMSEMLTKRLDKMWEMMDHVMEQKMLPGFQAGKPPDGWQSEDAKDAATVNSPRSETPAEKTMPQGEPQGWDKEEKKEGD